MTSFKAYYDKYIYSLIKEATKVRTNRIPKGSIIAKDIAEKYWEGRKGWDDSWDITPEELKELNKETRDSINRSQYTGRDKKTVHAMQLATIYEHYAKQAKEFARKAKRNSRVIDGKPVAEDLADSMQDAYKVMQLGNKALHKYTGKAYTAENVRQLLMPYTPKSVRKYIRNIPITLGDSGDKVYNKNNNSNRAFYAHNEGRAQIGRGNSGGIGYAAGHELFGHGIDAAYPRANSEQYARYKNYDNSQIEGTPEAGKYTFTNNGKEIAKTIPQGTMRTEGIASTRPVQYMRQALQKAPKRLAKRLNRNYERQNNISFNSYNDILKTGLPSRTATENERKDAVGTSIDRDINSLAKIRKIDATKELNAMPADKAYNNWEHKKTIVDTMIDALGIKDNATKEIYRNAFSSGISQARKERKDTDKVNKQNRRAEIAKRRKELEKRQLANKLKREQWQKAHPEEYARQQSRLTKTSYYKLYYNIFKYLSSNS